MSFDTLIVPGYHGSGPGHWQTWLERDLPGSRRLTGVDWENPVLDEWTAAITHAIDSSPDPIWIVAHSFGCLATAAAIAERPGRVRGVLLAAPAEPDRFTVAGARGSGGTFHDGIFSRGISDRLPQESLGVFGLLVASRNDPWMRYNTARQWADRWSLSFYDAGHVGHINVESGHGRWPLAVQLLNAMRRAVEPIVVPRLLRRSAAPRRGFSQPSVAAAPPPAGSGAGKTASTAASGAVIADTAQRLRYA